MMNKLKLNIVIKSAVFVGLGFLTSSSFALGYGQSASAAGSSQAAAISELLASNHALMSHDSGNNKIVRNPSQLANYKRQAVAPTSSVAASPTQPSLADSNGNNTDLGDTTDSKAAFANMTRNLMPLSPGQITTLRGVFDKSKRAAASYPGTPPRPTASSIMVDLSPGAVPPVIRLRSGFISAVQFLDSTGQPWPVEAYDLGDTGNFNVKWNQASNPGTLLVQAMSSYRTGNLAVLLKGKATPIMITLLPGQNAVDYRDELRVPGLGPNASPDESTLPDTSSPALLNILDGVAPNGAKQLQVSDGRSQAWLYNKKLYLRTRVTLLSPSWLSSMSSPDGTHVYQMVNTPVVLVSNRGELQQLKIQG